MTEMKKKAGRPSKFASGTRWVRIGMPKPSAEKIETETGKTMEKVLTDAAKKEAGRFGADW